MTETMKMLSEEEFLAIDKLLLRGKKIPAIKLLIDTIGGHVGEAKVVIEIRQTALCEIGLAEMAEDPPGARYCVATEEGATWLDEHADPPPPLHPKRHFYLYAKGHYERSNDLIHDLKQIAAAYCGMSPKHYRDKDLIILMGKEVFQYIKNENVFIDMLDELSPDSNRTLMFLNGEPYMIRLMSQFIKFLNLARIRDGDHVIINLGEADPDILPLSVVECKTSENTIGTGHKLQEEHYNKCLGDEGEK